jgi:hypothetical protein
MSLSLEELKNEWKQESENKPNFQSNLGDWYPFWKADFDTISTFRFLPFANPDVKNFLVEKHMHRLMVVLENGQTVQRQIPCLAQYGQTCPACQTSQKFYAEDDKKNGSAFYRKKSWVGQGQVIESPFEYDNPENPHKKISVGWQIFQAIKAGIMHDLEHHPVDLLKGYDFRIMKMRGADDKAAYTQSRFAPKSTPVSEDFLKDLVLYDPENVLPKEPSLDNMNAMLTSALTGEIYTSPGRASSDTPTSAFSVPDKSTSPAPVPEVPTETKEDSTPPWTEEKTPDSAPVDVSEDTSQTEDAILAAIRNRQNAKTSAD